MLYLPVGVVMSLDFYAGGPAYLFLAVVTCRIPVSNEASRIPPTFGRGPGKHKQGEARQCRVRLHPHFQRRAPLLRGAPPEHLGLFRKVGVILLLLQPADK